MGRPRKNPTADFTEVYQDEHGEWRWRALAGNNKVVADSGEGYHNRSHAKKMAKEMFPSARVR